MFCYLSRTNRREFVWYTTSINHVTQYKFLFLYRILYVTKSYHCEQSEYIYGAQREGDKSLTKRNLAETIKYWMFNKKH